MYLLFIFFFFLFALLLFQYHVCCAKLLQACLTLCDRMSCSPLSMGFSRQEYWSGLPSPSSSVSQAVIQNHFTPCTFRVFTGAWDSQVSHFFKKSQQPSNSSQVKILGHVLQRRQGWHGHLMVSCSAAQRAKRSSLSSKLSPRCLQTQGARVRDFSPHKLMGHENKSHSWS